MRSKSNLIESLQGVIGTENVLTDTEDIYVYSFEHFFRPRRLNNAIAVIRVETNEELKNVEELAHYENVAVVRRSTRAPGVNNEGAAPTILLDDAAQPELKVIDKNEGTERFSRFRRDLGEDVQGTFRDFALALRSLFSGLPAQKCLDCKVCNGYCTVAPSFNGVETWSSKGRTLLTRGLFADELQPSAKLVDVLYTCSLCGLCFAQCFENTQLRRAIMDARHRLADSRLTPKLFTATAKNIVEVGDPSGMPSSKRVAWTGLPQQRIIFPKTAEVMYWSGCIVSTRTPNVARALYNILSRAQVDFTLLGQKEGCCGYVLLASGLWHEAKDNALRLVERVKETKAETLITPCAGCYYTFTKMYPEIMDLNLPCQVLHAAQYVERLIDNEKIVPHDLDRRVTYHDPCSLGRHCGVYDSPRNVLKTIPNLEFVEMPLTRNLARCCGAGGGLWSFNNSVAMNAACERLVKDVAPLNASLVTTCPTCHINFRYTSVRKSLGTKVFDLVEIVDSATAS